MPLIFNPMLPFNFEEKDDIRIFVKDEEGNDVDITEYVATINSKLADKVNTFQGATNGNKVMITDPQGNVTTVAGVVMNQSEREKLASLTNPMLLKGVLESYEALYQVENPQAGWCYLVPFAENGENTHKEFVYTSNNRWELLGNFNLNLIQQYYSGVATEIDNNHNINVKYNPDVFEIDEHNRLNIKDFSYVRKCTQESEINTVEIGSIFHWQGNDNQSIIVEDTNGNQTYIKYSYFYKKEADKIVLVNKEPVKDSVAVDVNVSTWSEFVTAVRNSARITTRIHIISNITVTSVETLDMSNCMVYGHYHKWIVNNKTTILSGTYAYFNDVWIQGANNGAASTKIFTLQGQSSSSCTYIFDNCRIYNFLEVGNAAFIGVNSASSSSIHIILHLCSVNGESDGISNRVLQIQNGGNGYGVTLKVINLIHNNTSYESNKVGIIGSQNIIDSFYGDGSVEYSSTYKPDRFVQWGKTTYNKAIESVNNEVSVRYTDADWDIGLNSQNKLTIKGDFVKRVKNLSAYTTASEGEVVIYDGNGRHYKNVIETETIQPNQLTATLHGNIRLMEGDNSDILSQINDFVFVSNGETVDCLYFAYSTYDGIFAFIGDKSQIEVGDYVMGNNIDYNAHKVTEVSDNPQSIRAENTRYNAPYEYQRTIQFNVLQNSQGIKVICFDSINPNININSTRNDGGVCVINNNTLHCIKADKLVYHRSLNGTTLQFPTWKEVYYNRTEVDNKIGDGNISLKKRGSNIDTFSVNQKTDKTINIPNDVEMIYLTHSKALSVQTTDGYYDTNYNYLVEEDPATWTDPNPQHRITTDGYYYDLSTGNIYQVNNYETIEVTSNVTIQGDTNKLYCDINTNKLYRYDGSNFVALTREGKTYTLSSNNANIRLTDNDGQTQDVNLSTLINGLEVGNSNPQDDDYIVAQFAGGGTTNTEYIRRPLSKFWNWIKTKLGIGTNDGTFLRKDGTWATPSDSTKVAKAGDTMSGTLTFTTANAVNYNANNGNISMIRFKTGDADGHGIVIGGGGLTVIGAGESATTVAAQTSSGGSETMQVCSDGNVEIYANCQSGFSSAKKSYFDTDGDLNVNRYLYAAYLNQSSGNESSSATANSYIMFCNSDGFLRKATVAQIKSLVDTNTWRPLGTGASDACAGNDSRLSNSRPASDVYTWAKSASLQAAMQSALTSGSVTSMSNGSCNISWKQVGNIVYFSGYIKPTSTSFSVAVPGSYQQAVDFPAINKNLCQIFTLTTEGYIKNSTAPDTGNTYYFQCIGIKVI